MKILALDTATEACSVALCHRRSHHRRVTSRSTAGMPSSILPMVDAVLAEAGVTLAQLDAIAFGRGPGGFTGVRLAASVAQGLAFGAGLGVVPVSDLAAVAQRASSWSRTRAACSWSTTRACSEVYWAVSSVAGRSRDSWARVRERAADVTLPRLAAVLGSRRPRVSMAWPELARALPCAPAPRCSLTCCRAPSRSSRSARPPWRRGRTAGSRRGVAGLCQGPRRGAAAEARRKSRCHQTAIDCPCNAHATKTSPVMPCQQTCQPNRFWSSRTSARSAR